MSLKDKIKKLRENLNLKQQIRRASVTALIASASLLPKPPGLQNSLSDNPLAQKLEQKMRQQPNRLDTHEEITLSVSEFKQFLQKNPQIAPNIDMFSNNQTGKGFASIHNLITKGFDFSIRDNKGNSVSVKCGLNKRPEGFCLGAVKRLLYKGYGISLSNNYRAYQDKDYLLQSNKLLGMPINFDAIKKCPKSTIVVIPKCPGHKSGHIFIVVDKGVYCSDGKEIDNARFRANYSKAKGIYAFIPSENKVTLNKYYLKNNPKICEAVIDYIDAKQNPDLFKENKTFYAQNFSKNKERI